MMIFLPQGLIMKNGAEIYLLNIRHCKKPT